MKIVSYNIHSCIGTDRVCSPHRIVGVLKAINPDIICLQEVGWHLRGLKGFDQFNYLKVALGYNLVYATTKNHSHGFFGNATLTRWNIEAKHKIDLRVQGRIPRCALATEVLTDSGKILVVNAHLGLDIFERKRQLAVLARFLRSYHDTPIILCGDFNEPNVDANSLSVIHNEMHVLVTGGTFHSRVPILSLDRVYLSKFFRLEQAYIDRNDLARISSDHLPLVVDASLHDSEAHNQLTSCLPNAHDEDCNPIWLSNVRGRGIATAFSRLAGFASDRLKKAG